METLNTSHPLTKHSQPFNTFLLFSYLSLIYKTQNNMETKISHYIVQNQIFIDFNDALEYCDKIGVSYDEIIKTKDY